MNIKTMTVRLGLVKASLLSMILLTVGGVLIGTAFFLELASGSNPLFSALVFAIAIADSIALAKFWKLYTLSRKYADADSQNVKQSIVDLATQNPQWIMLVTQTYSFLSIMLLVTKFLP